jgi:SAM-dependent methyltransferase
LAAESSLVSELEKFLDSKHLFGCYDSLEQFEFQIEALKPRYLRAQVVEVMDELAMTADREEPHKRLYDLMGNAQVAGMLHGAKRSYILDAARLALGCCELEVPQGAPVLDVGCNTGYISHWLGMKTTRRILGVDLSAPCVELAVKLNECPRLEFRQQHWRGLGAEQFALIVNSDSEFLTPEFIDWSLDHLVDGGALLHIDDWDMSEVIAAISDFDCHIAHVELSGGFDIYNGFNSKTASVIKKGKGCMKPEPEGMWVDFAVWCNSNQVVNRRKCLSFFLATRMETD